MSQYDLSNEDERFAFRKEMNRLMITRPVVEFGVTKKTRTPRQNNALHKYFDLLAEELNTAGYDMRRTLKEGVDIPWSADTVKSFLWKPIMKAQLQKDSTTELSTKDIDTVYETLNRYLSDKFGLSVVFPSQDNK